MKLEGYDNLVWLKDHRFWGDPEKIHVIDNCNIEKHIYDSEGHESIIYLTAPDVIDIWMWLCVRDIQIGVYSVLGANNNKVWQFKIDINEKSYLQSGYETQLEAIREAILYIIKNKFFLKMTIDEAIKSRIDRFNRLWKSATGHTFEEDPQWCKDKNEREYPEWKYQMDEVLKKYGFKSLKEYSKQLYNDSGENTGSIKEIDDIWNKEPDESSLFDYEMFVINEAKRTAEFALSLGENWWKENAPGKSIYDIEKILKDHGYIVDDSHSGNTFGTMMRFTDCLLRNPDIFMYLHGALSLLVGDEGYHDDRSDLPKE